MIHTDVCTCARMHAMRVNMCVCVHTYMQYMLYGCVDSDSYVGVDSCITSAWSRCGMRCKSACQKTKRVSVRERRGEPTESAGNVMLTWLGLLAGLAPREGWLAMDVWRDAGCYGSTLVPLWQARLNLPLLLLVKPLLFCPEHVSSATDGREEQTTSLSVCSMHYSSVILCFPGPSTKRGSEMGSKMPARVLFRYGSLRSPNGNPSGTHTNYSCLLLWPINN